MTKDPAFRVFFSAKILTNVRFDRRSEHEQPKQPIRSDPETGALFQQGIPKQGPWPVSGAAHGPFAMVFHQGRKSGKHYQTPIIVAPAKDGFVIALTYGTHVDWYRNVLSAGRCKLRWHTHQFDINRIEPITPQEAGPYLPGFEKAILGFLGIKDFAKMWRAR